MWTIIDIAIYAAGFATCWFCKDPILGLVSSTDTLIKSLEVKLAAMRRTS